MWKQHEIIAFWIMIAVLFVLFSYGGYLAGLSCLSAYTKDVPEPLFG
jgi:hypothetical protein